MYNSNPTLRMLFGNCLQCKLPCDMMYFGTKDKRSEKEKTDSHVAVQLKENTGINPGEFPGSCTHKPHL